MLPRERVRAAFNHKEPDALPMDLGSRVSTFAVPLYTDFKKHLGYDDLETKILDVKANIADVDEPILEKYQIDTRYVYAGPPDTWKFELNKTPNGAILIDEWGVTYRKPEGGFYFDWIDHPFKKPELAAIDKYNWPDPENKARYIGVKEKAKAYYDRGYIVGSAIKGVWETLWVLRDMEKSLFSLMEKAM